MLLMFTMSMSRFFSGGDDLHAGCKNWKSVGVYIEDLV